MSDLARRRRIDGKYFYFHIGYPNKRQAIQDANRLRKMGYGARVLPISGYYYVYSTSSAGWRPNKTF